MDEILKHFPDLTKQQKEQFYMLEKLYNDWNSKINVISRKDIESLYIRHVLHSLAIAKVRVFGSETSILDVGTGGGFPGIPLAILFPEANFYLVDIIGKKIKVVQQISHSLGLKNIRSEQKRAELVTEKFDFVVSRAVTDMSNFVNLVGNKIKRDHKEKLKNGIFYLKGGDLSMELKPFPKALEYNISDFFENDFFETKKVVYLPFY